MIVTILVGVVVAVVAMWLVLLVCFAALRPTGSALSESVRIVPDAIRLVGRLAREPQLGRAMRLSLALLVGYLALPFDLVPDFIPILGYADDAILIGIVLRHVMRRAGPDVVRRHWPGTDDGLALLGRLCRMPELTPEKSV